MPNNDKEIAKAIAVALELIRIQHSEISYIKTTLSAIQESVRSSKPPLSIEAGIHQVLQEIKENGRVPDATLSLLNECLAKMLLLSK
jgi:hypothetical protein